MSYVSTIDLAEARSDESTQVVDVRETWEYVTGHVPGAVSSRWVSWSTGSARSTSPVRPELGHGRWTTDDALPLYPAFR